MSNKNHCEGCSHYRAYRNKASCVDYNKDGSCPCTICIVKLMCNNTCDNWETWYDSLCVVEDKDE